MPFAIRLIARPHVLLSFVSTSHLNFERTCYNEVEQILLGWVQIRRFIFIQQFQVHFGLLFIFAKEFLLYFVASVAENRQFLTMFMRTHSHCELSRAFYLHIVTIRIRNEDKRSICCGHVIQNRQNTPKNSSHECIRRWVSQTDDSPVIKRH